MKLRIKISPRNSKLGKIPNISTIPVKDCGNCDSCMTDCYALKAWKQYPPVRAAWKQNSQMFRKHMQAAFNDIETYFNSKRTLPRFFRIHVAGDFLNQEHVNGYAEIARKFPAIKFLAFTKMHDLDYSNLPDNLQIIASMWSGLDYPPNVKNMRKAWVQDGTETRIPDDAIECPGICDDCGMCWSLDSIGRDVYFLAH